VISRDFAAIRETITLPTPCCAVCAASEAKQQERKRLGELALRRNLGRILPPDAIARVLRADE
jgi:hypothetical protein